MRIVAVCLCLAACHDARTPVGTVPGDGCEEFCDPVQGVVCDLDTHECVGECAPELVAGSYVGCDYYPTVTANEVNSSFEFAVAISNSSNEPATVTIDWGALDTSRVIQLGPNEVVTERLPWVPDLKGCMGDVGISCAGLDRPESAIVPKGAYRLRSTRPVTVYQFSPLDYERGDIFSYTNDASLLFPATALGTEYVVASYGALPAASTASSASPGFVSITATSDDTQVTITTTANVSAGPRVAPFLPGVPQTMILHQGDVVALYTWDGDLTGSRIVADKPIQVIGGHECTYIPQDVGYCDHLEESMFPVAALGVDYVVAPPAMPTLPDGKVRVVRIVATAGATQLTYDPPQPGLNTLANAGDFVELEDTDETFAIHANKKVLVAEYMEGEDVAGGMGDPAMTLAAPTDQYRGAYRFHAPTNYDVSYVDVVAPVGAAITLDGAPVAGFTAVGGSGLAHARVTLGGGPAGDGDHVMTGDQPFGIQVYGYGQYTSYWYPGGLDLHPVVIP